MNVGRFAMLMAVVFMGFSLSAQEVTVQVAKYRDGKQCASSFTFDDGNKDNYTLAVPELESRGWRGTFWVNCSSIPGEVGGRGYKMTWDDLCDLHARGHEISNHGWSHKKMTKIPYEEAVREIERNDSAICAHLGVKPTTFCYPFNSKNKEIVELASKGRVGTRTFQYRFGEQASDEKMRSRMDKTIEEGKWAVWMTHGITRGYDCFKDMSRYTSFLDYVKDRESQIWVATFREVAAYIAERDAVVLTVTRKGRKVKVAPSLSLDPSLFNEPLTMYVTGAADVKVKQGGKPLSVVQKDGKTYFDFNPHGRKITISLE